MDKKELVLLAERFLQGIATDEEKTLLHQWYDNWEDDEQVVLTDNPVGEEQLKQQILSGLKQSLTPETAFHPQKNNRKKYWLAAASLLLIASTAVFFLYNGKKNQPTPGPTIITVTHDAAPGTDKAILTLADGSKITLDSTRSGNLAQQGSSSIYKQKEGELVYNTSGAEPGKVLFNTISTPRGGQYHVVLSDGTKVWLNAASSLTYPTTFVGAERKVELTGEAYFEVSSVKSVSNKKLPFIVNVKNMVVSVLGTEFNINAYDDEDAIKTTLLGGSVDISGAANTSLHLLPKQQSVYDAKGTISLVEDVDIEQVVAWKNGLFKFNSASLASIMRQVSRWYDVDISYKGNVKEETFSGDMPRAQNASEFFKVLETTKTVQFSIENKNVIIEPYKK